MDFEEIEKLQNKNQEERKTQNEIKSKKVEVKDKEETKIFNQQFESLK